VALPPGVNGKTVTFGTTTGFDGSPVPDGSRVTISTSKNVKHLPSGRQLVAGQIVRKYVGGVATFDELVPVDTDGLDRYDWTYRVSFEIAGASQQPEPFSFVIFDDDPQTIDGDTLSPVPSSIGTPVSVNALRLPPGGLTGQGLVFTEDFGVAWADLQPAGDYVTSDEVAAGLATKVNSSTYTAGLAAKLDTAGLDSAAAPLVADSASQTATALRAAYAPVLTAHPAGHRLVALGDSITIAGDNPQGSNKYVQRNDSIWQTAAALSGGSLTFARNAGRGGDTAAMMLARFDTDVTPYAPTMVSVMAGTNDLTFGATDSQYRTNMQALVAKIRSIGAVPLLLTSPPVNSFAASDRAKVIRNGRWLRRYAAEQGLICIDTFALMVDPATSGAYRAGYDQGDGIHPSVPSRVLIGQALWAALAPLLPPTGTVGAVCDLDPTNLIAGTSRHPLFLGGSSGGFPAGWFAGDSPSSGSGANSIVDDAQMPGGKALRLTLTGATGNYGVRTDIASGFAPGDHLHMSCLVNQQTSGAIARLLINWTVDALHWTQTSLTGRFGLQMEVVVPAGATACFIQVQAVGAGSTGNVDFGAIALRNLTAEGSASTV